MTDVIVIEDASGRVRCRVAVARRLSQRLVGLLGRQMLSPDQGLLLVPCSAIHTWGMQFAIDVVFVDADGRILEILPCLAPWRFACFWGARFVIELANGQAHRLGLHVGLVLSPLPGLPAHAA